MKGERQMEESLSSLHWLLIALVLGFGISFSHKWLPSIYLAKLGTLPYFSANWITTWSIVIWYTGLVIYLAGYFYYGSIIMIIGGSYDKLDGHVARAKKICGFPRTLKSILIGTWWDPLADKIRQLPVIAFMAWMEVFPLYLLLSVIAVDVLGTFVREPFTNEKFTKKYRIFAFIKSHLRQSEASNVGKGKSFFQVMAIVFAGIFLQGLIDSVYIPLALLWIALPLGVLSVISRVKIHRDVDKAVDEVHAIFVSEKPSN